MYTGTTKTTTHTWLCKEKCWAIFLMISQQTSANNSTGYYDMKITLKSAFIRGWIPCPIVVRYSSLHIHNRLLQFIYCYHYQASTWLRYQRFENCLEVEPQVGTPICRSLLWTIFLKLVSARFSLTIFIKHNCAKSCCVSWNMLCHHSCRGKHWSRLGQILGVEVRTKQLLPFFRLEQKLVFA